MAYAHFRGLSNSYVIAETIPPLADQVRASELLEASRRLRVVTSAAAYLEDWEKIDRRVDAERAKPRPPKPWGPTVRDYRRGRRIWQEYIQKWANKHRSA